MEFDIRLGERNHMRIDYFKLNRFSEQPLPRDIAFGDFDFAAGTTFRSKLDWRVMTWSLGLFAAVTFVVCGVYGLIVPESLHMTQFLEMVLPGFRWLTVWSFVLKAGRATDVRRHGFRVNSLSSFGLGAAGQLYLVSHEGTIFRLARR